MAQALSPWFATAVSADSCLFVLQVISMASFNMIIAFVAALAVLAPGHIAAINDTDILNFALNLECLEVGVCLPTHTA